MVCTHCPWRHTLNARERTGRLLNHPLCVCWGGGGASRLKDCAGWYFPVHVPVRLLRRESSAWPTPTTGENHFYSVRVEGQLSLRSQVLLLPRGVPPIPASAMLHTNSFPTRRSLEGADHRCSGKCDTGSGGSGSPSVGGGGRGQSTGPPPSDPHQKNFPRRKGDL